ncbi:MAG: hypothetical protein ACQEWV_21140 [Bacillota bacterium]
MMEAIEQPFRAEELSSGSIYLGILYSKSKEYTLAADLVNGYLKHSYN